jgi:hypothetical protein
MWTSQIWNTQTSSVVTKEKPRQPPTKSINWISWANLHKPSASTNQSKEETSSHKLKRRSQISTNID